VSVQELYRKGRRAAAWGIAINLALGGVKLAGGLAGHSFALVSDSVNSLGDAVTWAVVLGALAISELPPDRSHPYGHARAETLAGAAAALMLLATALWIGWEALSTLGDQRPRPEAFTLLIAAVSAAVKEGLYWYYRATARHMNSRSFLATAWNHRLDALSSLVVVAGVTLSRWAAPPLDRGDTYAALLVAVFVLWVGGRLLWGSLHELMDHQADPELLREVRETAAAVPGVRCVEKLLIRKAGLEFLADMHVEVDPELTVREGHTIAHAVKDHVRKRMPSIKDVLIHVEPARDA
jgi:cation diffusion facilitator family transporter